LGKRGLFVQSAWLLWLFCKSRKVALVALDFSNLQRPIPALRLIFPHFLNALLKGFIGISGPKIKALNARYTLKKIRPR